MQLVEEVSVVGKQVGSTVELLLSLIIFLLSF